MVFNSITFLLFFAAVLLMHTSRASWRAKKTFLVLASYIFYGAWNPPFVLLLAFSTLVDWHLAKRMPAATDHQRKLLLSWSLFTNLGLLAAFKYGDFLLGNFNAFLRLLGVEYEPVDLGIILPVGISFYTFQTLSYTIDVYRGKLDPWPRFVDFALFVSFFPQLVAGPIVRASHFLPQCTTVRRADKDEFAWGATLFLVGLFQKVVLADSMMAPIADHVYSNAVDAGFVDAWVGTLAFSAQIFFDFAGYSTCAIGVGLMLGFALPDNFRYPYAAMGFSDFWRRWHISLSSWLRDYLYVPLGGNRLGARRTQVNLLVTMLLGGLWHGAAWRFVVWGGLHGAFLMVERRVKSMSYICALTTKKWAMFGLILITYVAVCFTWVFFRAPDWRSAVRIVSSMAGIAGDRNIVIGEDSVLTVFAVTAALLLWHWWMRDSSLEEKWLRFPLLAKVCLIAIMLFAILVTPVTDRAFIYFQF